MFVDHDDEVRHTNGGWLSLQTRIGPDGTVPVHVRDITSTMRLQKQAETDPLTGLLNRRVFDRAVGCDPGAQLFVDVDHFNAFNDRHGHDKGDLVLQ